MTARDVIPHFPSDRQDSREWRVGSHYGIHLYAVNPDGDDEPLGTVLRPEIARQIVAEHQYATIPFCDPEHTGGSWLELLMALIAENLRLRELVEAHPNLASEGESMATQPDAAIGQESLTRLVAHLDDQRLELRISYRPDRRYWYVETDRHLYSGATMDEALTKLLGLIEDTAEPLALADQMHEEAGR
jgi:hypothetical protein